MKASTSFVCNPGVSEYVIKLKSFKFPWWILLIPLLLLLLLIKIDKKIDFTVVDASTKKVIENSKVVLSYQENETKEKRSMSLTTNQTGKVEFVIAENRIYQLIFGNSSSDNIAYSAIASKEKYIPDSIINATFKQLNANTEKRILKLKTEIAKIPDSLKNKPREGCRAFFTGLIVGGEYKEGDISEVYKTDKYSEYVGAGEYADNEKTFPKSVKYTFDGIAIDKGTRVIIYSKKNFEGEVLLDKTGPAIINNVRWKNDRRYGHCNTDTYKEPLQSNFPQSVREWSKTDMHVWSYGSVKVICN